VGAWWFHARLGWSELYIPFYGFVDIGAWYILFFVFVIVATAFSANETDGLDGLAGGVLFFAFMAFAIVAFVTHKYELLAMNATILGALLAFLWFNVHPAKFFMGDTGSMGLGVVLAVVAFLTKSVLLLPIIGFIFVLPKSIIIFSKVTLSSSERSIFFLFNTLARFSKFFLKCKTCSLVNCFIIIIFFLLFNFFPSNHTKIPEKVKFFEIPIFTKIYLIAMNFTTVTIFIATPNGTPRITSIQH
jgi:UDP-N-acetylmuramyl pentapeptide phosphotransferase/UDP-N-acetylglucosamine-1-phosphate transferase